MLCIVIDPKLLVRKEPNVDIEDEAEELPPQRTVVPARAPALEEEVEELEEMMEDVSLSTFVAVGLDEKYPHIAYLTGYMSDGRMSVVFDFLVRSTGISSFKVETAPNGNSFVLSTRLPSSYLDAMGRAELEFDPRHTNTFVYVAGIRRTVNKIAESYGTNFEMVWSNGTNYVLPYPCNPNPNIQLIWHSGCHLLFAKRTNERGCDMNTLHQQMPILRVTYTSREMQRVAGFTSDDIIINTTPTRNSLGNGSAPPQPRSSNGGGRGGGGGNEFRGGFSGGGFGGGGGLSYNHKGTPMELALGADGLHVPSPFAESQHCRRVRSPKERVDVDMNDGNSKVAAARMPGVRGVRVELVGSEGEIDSL